MGAWYWIGVAAGLGASLGVLSIALARRLPIALPLALAAGAGAGWLLGEVPAAAAGCVAGALGALGARPAVTGALERGGTRGGTAILVAVGALVLAAAALVPALGYLSALALPLLAVRLRRRQRDRHAGLRILARD